MVTLVILQMDKLLLNLIVVLIVLLLTHVMLDLTVMEMKLEHVKVMDNGQDLNLLVFVSSKLIKQNLKFM